MDPPVTALTITTWPITRCSRTNPLRRTDETTHILKPALVKARADARAHGPRLKAFGNESLPRHLTPQGHLTRRSLYRCGGTSCSSARPRTECGESYSVGPNTHNPLGNSTERCGTVGSVGCQS